MQPFIHIVAAILIVGVLVWGIDQLPGIDPTFKQIARVLLIVALVIFALLTLLSFIGSAFPTLGWRP
jgi:preprotein translocase subunit SecE